jgi:hypothetical protein
MQSSLAMSALVSAVPSKSLVFLPLYIGDANIFSVENRGKRKRYQGTEKDCDNDASAPLAIHTVSMASATP